MRYVWFVAGFAFVAWGLIAIAVPLLDAATGQSVDLWSDVLYALAFLLAGLAFVVFAALRYRGGWYLTGGILIAHFGLVLVSGLPAELRAGHLRLEGVLELLAVFAGAAALIRKGHLTHRRRTTAPMP